MREDFAVFILTHGRPKAQHTVRALKNSGYTGKIYFILDNEDDTLEEYEKEVGKENIVIFDKQEEFNRTDTMDLTNEHRAIVFARNKCWDIAKDLRLNYFLQLDDDIDGFYYRYPDETLTKLASKQVNNMDTVFEAMINLLNNTDALLVCMAQGGDFISGVTGRYAEKMLRKVMNSFFCRTDRPVRFCGTMNEDVNCYTTLGQRGEKLFTVTDVMLKPFATQSIKGGMTEVYKDSGTYQKSFYSVMCSPSCVEIQMMKCSSKHQRIHHKVLWGYCVPKILNERWKKKQ